jgi:hypothetical protein
MNERSGWLIGGLLAICGAAFCAAPLVGQAAGQDASAELQQRADQASGAQCARLNMQAARHALDDAKRLFESGEVKAAHHAIDFALGDVRHAVDCSVHAGKGEKATEIDLRRLIERTREVSQALDTEDRPHLSQSLVALEEQRDRLLQAIFGAAAGGGVAEKKP